MVLAISSSLFYSFKEVYLLIEATIRSPSSRPLCLHAVPALEIMNRSRRFAVLISSILMFVFSPLLCIGFFSDPARFTPLFHALNRVFP